MPEIHILFAIIIITLQIKRIRLDLYFTFKLLNGIINCSELLAKFNFLVPTSRTRKSNRFYTPFHRNNYAQNAPITRLIGHMNRYNVDLFFYNNNVSFNVYFNNNVNIV